MLVVDNVTKLYGDFKAVDNLSFKVEKGEIFGLLGMNGAGKTTTFRMILNLIEPSNGEITLDDKKIDYDVTDKIGYLPEERSLLVKLTVLKQAYYYGGLKGMTQSSIEESLDYWLNYFNITEYKNKKINELSKGNQQKIQFIMAVLHNPSFLILDEPFSGLDPYNLEIFKNAMLEMQSRGASIIFSSHRMEHVELFCEKLTILMNGRDVLSGKLTDIKNSYSKRNVVIEGNLVLDELYKLGYIEEISEEAGCYIVKITDVKYANDLFEVIKNYSNITHYEVKVPSLNDIFIEKVGEEYGQ